MTLAGASPYKADRPQSIRLAALATMALGFFALLSILLAQDRQTAVWAAGFPGVGLLIWGGIQVWAATSRHLSGTKLLAMFMAILGIVLVGSSFLIQDTGPFRWTTILLGVLVFAVSLVDAFLSPDERRGSSFGPSDEEDAADLELASHHGALREGR